MADHTPTPWTMKSGPFWVCQIGSGKFPPQIWSEYEVLPAQSHPWATPDQDAAFIVRAANSHERFVAVLEQIVKDDDDWGSVTPEDFADRMRANADDARTALARIK